MLRISRRALVSTVLAAGIAAAVASLAALTTLAAHGGDSELLLTEKNLLKDYPARNTDGTVNVVVEIPTGTTAKWETLKDGTGVAWQRKNGKLRVVQYLGYPGNYGMVPRTLLPRELGGDGDPLDVLVLGDPEARGSVIAVRVIGSLALLDDDEQDDKLVAVVAGSPLGHVRDIAQLDADYPGITNIIETWFSSYKGPGRMMSKGFVDAATSGMTVSRASEAFEKAHAK